MDKDKTERQGKVLNCGKVKFNSTRQELGRIDCEHLILGKSTSDRWKSFKGYFLRTQDQCVPVRKIDKNCKVRKTWMTRDVTNLMKNEKARYVGS